MMPARLLTTAFLSVCIASPLSSQRLTQRAGVSAPVPATTAARSMQVTLRRDGPPNDWLKGTIVGGAAGLVLGFLLMGPSSPDRPGARQYMLKLTIMGAAIGMLIGATSQKYS